MEDKKINDNYNPELLWITNASQLSQHPQQVEQFFKLYQHPSNFPDPDELEEPDFIRDRIACSSKMPYTHLMMCFLKNQAGEKYLAGGCIVEFYPDSACGLVTYLFVDLAWRGMRVGPQKKKVAEILVQADQGLPGLVDFFRFTYKTEVNAVFFESNNPALTDPSNDSMPPLKRLGFFDRVGAKRVFFDYAQPPLGDGKGLVENLFLLAFPSLSDLTDQIKLGTVIRFIAELARSLDQNKSSDAESIYGEENYQSDLKVLETLSKTAPDSWKQITLKGLTVKGKNVINDTFRNLIAHSSGGYVSLVCALNKI